MLVAQTEPCHIVGEGLLAVMTSHLPGGVGLVGAGRLWSMLLSSGCHSCVLSNRPKLLNGRAGHYNFRQAEFRVPVVFDRAVHLGQLHSQVAQRLSTDDLGDQQR